MKVDILERMKWKGIVVFILIEFDIDFDFNYIFDIELR